ncbi:MAG: DUF1848 domain-containing protein [Candidatus Altarchaeaceae archaeon]
MYWEKVKIIKDDGKEVEAIAPLIISASRATDIPAFYSKWFFNRLKKGYIKWINPFNNTFQYVSFKNLRVIVFWSKNPKQIFPYLKELDDLGINYYFQFTLNDYEEENFEPNIPKLNERIETFKELSNRIGKEKIIWRFDPLILTDKINVDVLLDRIKNIGDKIHNYTEKLVISFVDIEIYSKVKKNLKNFGINAKEFEIKDIEKIANGLKNINKEWNLKISTCAEKVNLERYGIEHNKCIDDELMRKVFYKDKKLIDFLSKKNLKDKGQRKECKCIVSKDIGQYNTCPHLCVYCYANYSKSIVMKNFKNHNENFESIVITS